MTGGWNVLLVLSSLPGPFSVAPPFLCRSRPSSSPLRKQGSSLFPILFGIPACAGMTDGWNARTGCPFPSPSFPRKRLCLNRFFAIYVPYMVVKSIYICMILYGPPRFLELRYSLLRSGDGWSFGSSKKRIGYRLSDK